MVRFAARRHSLVEACALLCAVAVAIAAGLFAAGPTGADDEPRSASAATPATGAAAPGATGAAAPGVAAGDAAGAGGADTLIVYDSTGEWATLGEEYAIQVANLSSRFGRWTATPVTAYKPDDIDKYTALVYVGSTYDEPLPSHFLEDVTATETPVLWLGHNLWQLTAHDTRFAARRGFMWKGYDEAAIAEVRYRGVSLTRDKRNTAGVMDHAIFDAAKATPVAEAVRADGTTLPWGVRSGNLTYVGELPFSYVTHDDRYLAFADLLFDVLAPGAAAATTRHLALVRIEDVGPNANPAELRAVADYLHSRQVRFSVAVYPRYRNPRGIDNNGAPQDITLRERPAVVEALRYMQERGGELLLHGYTHQYETAANPYQSVSGDDFEFYAAHLDSADNVVYDGPVPGNSAERTTERLRAATAEFEAAGLAAPTIFEFPHYAGSAVDYRVVDSLLGVRYDRGLYFPGTLAGRAADHRRATGQFFPYLVRDVYGSVVIPENLGNVVVEGVNQHSARTPAEIVASAERNLVVRDGTASFFYHPYLGTSYLAQVVEGIQGLGYTFVSASSLATGG